MSARVQRGWSDVVAVRPVSGTGWVAARAATCMLVPMLALDAAGHLEWALYATFGAFASAYGGGARTPDRWRLQAALGALLTASVVCGALVSLSPARHWIAIPVAAAWAAAGAGLSDAYRWRPHGPMFLVFAFAACSAVPGRPADLPAAALLSGAVATLAVGLGALDVAWAGRRPSRPGPPPRAPVEHPFHRRVVQAVRCAAAVLVAGVAATATGIGHPYWAMVSAVVPMAGHTYREQMVRGVHRLTGTLGGVVLAGVLLSLHLPALASIVVVALLQAAAESMVARNYGLALLAITPLALLLGQLAAPTRVWTLVGDRALETGIGVAVGLVAVTITRSRGLDDAVAD